MPKRTSVFDQIVASASAMVEDVATITELDPRHIAANPYQPRRTVDAAAQAELEASIREGGIHEPLIVRRVGVVYQLVAGGRRLAAALTVGLPVVPVVVRDYRDDEARAVALIENLQRENLVFDDEAFALAELKKATGWPATTIAKKMGKSSDYVDLRLQAAIHPDLLARYMAGEFTTVGLMAAIRDRRASGQVGDSVSNGIEARAADSVTNGIMARSASPPRRPHNAYRPLDAAVTTLAKLSAAPLNNDERLELRRRALKIREAADRVLEQLGDEE